MIRVITLAILAILILFIPLSSLLPNNKISINENSFEINSVITNIVDKEYLLYVSSNSWDGTISEISDIKSIGNIMYTNYSIWLILTSIILLLSMVGSIVITVKQKY